MPVPDQRQDAAPSPDETGRGAQVQPSLRETKSIAILRGAARIWAVGAVHGDVVRLRELHRHLEERLAPRDAIVYLGNYLGYGAAAETVTELLDFRRQVLARPPLWLPDDIVYLRGSQEEMWQKLLQLQFAGDARSVLNWMLARGVDATLTSYGGNVEEGRRNAAAGTMALNSWTRQLRESVRGHPAHDSFMSALKRAAATDNEALLLVNCGVDRHRPLAAQSDAFWWAGRSFTEIDQPYEGFRKVIRGFDPAHGGFADAAHTLTVDGGCGFDGPLIAACIAPTGETLDRIEV